jgi:hypothetical protein
MGLTTINMKIKKFIILLPLILTTNVGKATDGKMVNIESLPQRQILKLVEMRHRELEAKYNISRPQKYHIPENYYDIASMYGPKGRYVPSVEGGIAICYGVYIHPNGRVLPDPAYADQTTLENASKALKRRYELAKLEYIAIKTYNEQISKAHLIENE